MILQLIMATQNVLEVISKGSIEMYENDTGDIPRKTSTGTAVYLNCTSSNHTIPVSRPESQLSLETLLPEVPSSLSGPADHAIDKSAVTDCDSSPSHSLDTDGLYERIRHLAESVEQEVRRASEETNGHQESNSLEEITMDSDRPVVGGARSKQCAEGQDAEMLEKIQRALAKMKRMDVKLNDLIKRERDVKRHRKLLEQQREALDSERGTLNSDALVPLDFEEEGEWLGPPVFPTQPHCKDQAPQPTDAAGQGDQLEQMGKKRQELKGAQNFIKRNIELAADAGSIVAMTEMEKQRLKELLGDGVEDDGTDDEDKKLSDTAEQEERESKLPISGFSYSKTDIERLRDIDSQLQSLVPVLSVCPTPLLSSDTAVDSICTDLPTDLERIKNIDSRLEELARERETEDKQDSRNNNAGGLDINSEVSLNCSYPPSSRPSEEQIQALLAQYRVEQEN